MYDIHNDERMIKGPITRDITFESGLTVRIMQEDVIDQCTLPIIKQINPELIIEFGTHQGGFSLCLAETCPDATIHTFDVYPGVSDTCHFPSRIGLHIANILEPSLTTHAFIVDLLQDKRRKLLYCDNGNKKLEVKIFSKYLNNGDFIGVHDWGREIFWDDINLHIGNWEKIGWPLLEEHGALSRFWRR